MVFVFLKHNHLQSSTLACKALRNRPAFHLVTMETAVDNKADNTIHMEESKPKAVLAISKQVANYEDAQHTQTKIAAFRENWKGIIGDLDAVEQSL